MHYYIYDSFLNHKKYESILIKVEARLTDLGINGKIEKLTILKSLKEMVEDSIKKGAETIVAVGDDSTLAKIITLVADQKVTLGFIPIGENNNLAAILGIPGGEAACDILSRRVVEKIDLGKANNQYFLFSLKIPRGEITLECNDKYTIRSQENNHNIKICNFVAGNADHEKNFNPKDGILEAVISGAPKKIWNVFKKEYRQDSIFPIKKVKIKSLRDQVALLADSQTVIKTPVTVEVAPKKLKIIVGKTRQF